MRRDVSHSSALVQIVENATATAKLYAQNSSYACLHTSTLLRIHLHIRHVTRTYAIHRILMPKLTYFAFPFVRNIPKNIGLVVTQRDGMSLADFYVDFNRLL